VSLIEISRVLEETARLLRQHARGENESPTPLPPHPVDTPASVRAILAVRRLRRELLGSEVGEAEWSLMLELYAASLEKRSVHQTGLAVAAGVSQSTALHATRRLIAQGIFTSRADPGDRRRLLIVLSEPMAKRIRAFLIAATRIAPPAA
jgi:DNA-binding MarR family transcriptional regulator